MTHRFFRYELRTTAVDAARDFYGALFGPDFWEPGIEVNTLPPQAAARGAVPHWLGHLAVDDVPTSAERFITHGATPLGPATHGRRSATLRDPFGAVVALSAEAGESAGERIAWHVLNAVDEVRAFSVYADLFKWTPADTVSPAPEGIRSRTFSWNGVPAGSIANTASQPHIHPHWLFFFRTKRLEESLATIRALGGLALPVFKGPDGSRLAACEDRQHAAFGVYQA
jgi:predicted enzyme related to lactoylglutathione lyase